MASPGESASPRISGYFVGESDISENLPATQVTPPDSEEAVGPLAANIHLEFNHESNRGVTPTSSRVRSNTSDSVSISALSSQSRSSSDPSLSNSPSFLSIQASDGSVDAIAVERGRLYCVFPRCSVSFDINFISREDWYSHNLAHFGSAGPPSRSLCIFCNMVFSHTSPGVSWLAYMHHLGEHFENGRTIYNSRPDFAFFRYLKNVGLCSESYYQHIMRYTERPQVDGLRPFDYIPEEIRKRSLKEDRVIVRDKWQNRHHRMLARREANRTNQEGAQQTQKRNTSKTRPQIIQDWAGESGTVFAHNFDQSNAEITNLDMPTDQETIEISTGKNEADRYLHDARSLSDILCDSDSDESLSSQDRSIRGYAQTSCSNDTTGYSETCLRLDYDADEDLMDPVRYKRKLQDIQEIISENSIAILLESYYQSSADFHTSHDLDPVLSYSEMLGHIEQNIHTLQKAGFCQRKLSFLVLDPSRSDVASLISVPIDKFLNLRPNNVAADAEHLEALQHNEPASLNPKQSTGSFSASQSINERSIMEAQPLMNPSSLNQSNMQGCELTVLDPHPHLPMISTRMDLINFQDSYPESTSESSVRARLEKSEFRARKSLLRVPDPYPGTDGIIEVNRGSVTVVNHMMRHEEKYEPRASECISAKFHKSKFPKFAAPSQSQEIQMAFKATTPGSSWKILLDGCIELLQSLHMELSVENPTHIVYTALRVMDLIVLSYSRAHISPVEKFTNGSSSLRSFYRVSGTHGYSSSNPCQPQKGTITLASRKLKCLNGFLNNNEVWVFHGEQSDPRKTHTLYLSTLPEDFADIWGPMWKMANPSNAACILRYDLEHGSIIPWRLSQGNLHLKERVRLEIDEELCHWISNNELRREGHLADDVIISKPRMLIGAKKRIKLEQNSDCHCEASHITRKLRDSCALRPIGTNRSRRRVDAEAVNGALGGGITGLQFTYSMVTKIDRGTNFKESLIKRWSHDRQRRNPHILLKHAALEMSFCTHNSRRIRLIDLLSTKTILKLLAAINPISDQECSTAVREILETDPIKLVALYIEKPEWREDIAAMVSSCLETLCDTGVKREMTEPISLFWMYDKDEYILTLPRSSHRWSGFIQDSLQSCAFVVFEEKCLTMVAGRGCQHDSRTGKNRARNQCDPLLESALVVNERMDLPVNLKLMKKGKDKDLKCWDVSKLEHGTKFKTGDSGGLEVIVPLSRTRLLVKWLPKNPFKAGFHDLLSRIVEKDPEMHHMEYDGEIITGDPLPINIFVVA